MKKIITHTAVAFATVAMLALTVTAFSASIQPIDGEPFDAAVRSIEGQTLTVAPAKTPDKPVKLNLSELHRVVWAPIAAPSQPGATVAAATVNPDGTSNTTSGMIRKRRIIRNGVVISDTTDSGDAPPPPPPGPKTKTLPVQWQTELVGGDRVRGEPVNWADGKLTVRPAAGSVGSSEFIAPENQVQSLWRSDADLIAEARAKIAAINAAETDDVLVVMKDEQLQAVAGKMLSMDKTAVKFRFMDQDRSLETGRMVGVVLATKTRAQPASGTVQRVRLKSGDWFTGVLKSASDSELTLTAAWGDVVRFNISAVSSVEFRGSRVTYLSDLSPVDVEQVPYFDRLIAFRTDQALGGGPLVLADGVYDKGVAVHARTVLQYDLGGRYETFRAQMGFQQPEGRVGRAVVRVIADGKALFENADAHGDAPPTPLKLSVANVKRLTLEVDFGAEQDVGDRVVWADARLISAAPAPASAPDKK